MEFVQAFRKTVHPRGLRESWLPWNFVDAWTSFVDDVETGYDWGLYEYEDEITVRDDLEGALTDQGLYKYESWRALVVDINAADLRMRSLLNEGPRVNAGAPWWRERLPQYAGTEMVEDVENVFKVRIREV